MRGRVVSSLVDLDGDAGARARRRPGRRPRSTSPCRRRGRTTTSSRYPVAIVGPGYRGLLTSGSTRIDGLVSLADIAPTAKAIAAGEKPPIRSRADRDAAATLARLDARLTRAHDARTGATLVLVGWLVAFAALGILARSALAGRAAVLVAPVALGDGARCLRAVGVDEPAAVVVAARGRHGAGLVAARAAAGGARPGGRRASWSRSSSSLAAWPEVNALAAIGPHPDGGGRFYGVTNQVETLLLAPSLAAAAAAGVAGRGGDRAPAARPRRLEPGRGGRGRPPRRRGGVRRAARRARPRPAHAGAGRPRASSACSRVGLAIVGIDALLGGSSHVTDAVGGGPGTLLDDLDRRLRISWAGATSAAHTAFLCLLSLGGLAWLGVRGRGRPAIVAMLVAIGVSLLVNDTPVDVLGYGALGCLALTAWDETRAPEPLSERSCGSEPPSRATRAPCALTDRSSRTTPARAVVSRTVPSSPRERQPAPVVQYGDQFVAMR